MRVALFSDVHGNAFALESMLADVNHRNVDTMVCLGDAVQGGAQPTETILDLRSLKCPIVMGNSDAWLLDEEGDAAEQTTKEQQEVREWTLSRLSDDDLDFIRSFTPTVQLDVGGRNLLCFHGTPKSFDEVLLPDTPLDEWKRALGPYSPSLMAGGHTHTQQVRRVLDGLFVNPGSVGVALDNLDSERGRRTDAWAEYAILEAQPGGTTSVEFRRVPYDLQSMVSVILKSGRPHAEKMVSGYTGRDVV